MCEIHSEFLLVCAKNPAFRVLSFSALLFLGDTVFVSSQEAGSARKSSFSWEFMVCLASHLCVLLLICFDFCSSGVVFP